MLVLVIGLPLLLLLVAVLVLAAMSDQSDQLGEVVATAFKSMDKDGSLNWLLVMLAVLLPVAVILQLLQRTCYLSLNAAGIEGRLPWWTGMGIAGLTTGEWKVRWDSIRSVRLLAGKLGGRGRGKPVLAIRAYRLLIETDREQIRISPFPWKLPGGPDHRLSFGEMFPARRFDVAKAIERAPLVQALRARGVEFSAEAPESENKPAGYDLAKHPGMIAQLVILFAVGLYAFVDGFFIKSFMALEPLPIAPFLIAAVAGAAIAFVLGSGAPLRERWVVACLLAAALGFAVYPGLLRFNAMSAEPQEVPYLAVGPGVFEPVMPRFPDIDLRKLKVAEYWSEYPEGSEYEFELIRGAGDFWQVDLRPVYKQTRDFYSQ